MNLKEFTEEAARQLQECLGDGYTVQTSEINKNNGVVRQGIQITETDNNISPCIFMEEYYVQWQENRGRNMDAIVDEIIQAYQKCAIHQNMDVAWMLRYDQARNKLRGRLINEGKNRGLLETSPHRTILDLCLTYYLEISVQGEESAVIQISNHLADCWEITEEELFQDMMAGLEQEKTEFISLEEMVMKIMGHEECTRLENGMYVLTNRKKLYGAIEMLNMRLLKEIAESMSKDLLILPSSVHEVIILPENGSMGKEDIGSLAKMVQSINCTELMGTEILSDHVYRFERRKGELKIAG